MNVRLKLLFILFYINCNVKVNTKEEPLKKNEDLFKKNNLTYNDILKSECKSWENVSFYLDMNWASLKGIKEQDYNTNIEYPFVAVCKTANEFKFKIFYSSKKNIPINLTKFNDFWYYKSKRWLNGERDTITLYNIIKDNKRFVFEDRGSSVKNINSIEIHTFTISKSISDSITENHLYMNQLQCKVDDLFLENFIKYNNLSLSIYQNKVIDNGLFIIQKVKDKFEESIELQHTSDFGNKRNSIFYIKTWWDYEVFGPAIGNVE